MMGGFFMRRFNRILCALLALCLCITLLPAPQAKAASAKNTLRVSFRVATYQNRARTLLKELNSLRRANGLEPLTMLADLESAALQRAAELFVFFDHARPDLTDYDTVLKVYKQLDKAYEAVVECIGSGFSKADEMAAEWFETAEELILDGDFTHAGVACVQVDGSKDEYYWSLILVQLPADTSLRKAASTTKAGTEKNMTVEIAKGMYERADNSHRRFELRVEDMTLKTKTSGAPTVYLYDRYGVRIGKCNLEDLTFKSSDTGVFTVNQDGTVKKKKNGTATLTVKAPGLDAATCKVTIGATDGAATASTIGDIVPELTAKAYAKHTNLTVYVKGASGYVLYRATAKGGKYTKVDEAATTSRWTYKLEDLDRTYYYKVRAYKNSNGKRVYSEYSEPVKVEK